MALKNKIEMKPTTLPHVYLIDWDDNGLLQEIAVVHEFPDGTIAGVKVSELHTIDKARIKKVVTGLHADKYPLYELLSQARFSNGLNGLDYVHNNFVKMKRPKGAKMVQDSLANIKYSVADSIIGSEFANPAEALLDKASRTFA
jgi:hypothetical protein